MRLKIAARRSDLARLQAYQVGEALAAANPGISIEYQFKESLGDKNQNDPLWKMPERGVFTEDFHDDLLSERCDLVVHSWKDLPVENRQGSAILATMKRADSRDLLLFKKTSRGKNTLKIFSSSPRRAYNLQSFLPGALPFAVGALEFLPVRGNIPTRLRKYREEAVDGIVVAKAALDRLLTDPKVEFSDAQKEIRKALEQSLWMVLPLEANPAAAAQGALAIEAKKGRPEIAKLLEKIHCKETFAAVEKERKILSSYGGGCHQKIGVSVVPAGKHGVVTYLRGLTDQGEVLQKSEFVAHKKAPHFSRAEKWPDTPEMSFFERQEIPLPPQPKGALFIARVEALPAAWQPEGIVWTSGYKTWEKLAKRGVWVNGSNEGRGESLPEIAALAPDAKFTKLTHREGYAEGEMPVLATYALVPTEKKADFSGKKFCFWPSGSAFLEALRQNPSLLELEHASGPGNTHEILQKNLAKTKSAYVFLSYKQWLED